MAAVTRWNIHAHENTFYLTGKRGAGFAPNRFSRRHSKQPASPGETPLPSRTNYFSGSSPEGWRTNVPNYERVRIRELFRHVDLVFHGSEGVIEYDFVAHPGADLTAIRFQILGARRLRVEANGSLLVVRNRETIRWKAPAIYQANGATRVAVTGRYEIGPHHTVAFRVGTYDPTRELIIDPVLAYASYLGGSGKELRTCCSHGCSRKRLRSRRYHLIQSVHYPGGCPAILCRSFGSLSSPKFSATGGLLYTTFVGGSLN